MRIVTTALLSAALVGTALAQGTGLYVPVKLIGDQGITLKGWGSGTISETDETAFDGTRSIRISSRNYFQGGVLTYATPIDLSAEFKDKSNLMRIVFKAPDTTIISSGGADGGKGNGGPGAGGPAGGGLGQGGPGRGGPGQGGPGQGGPGRGGQGGPGASPGGSSSSVPKLENIRVIVSTTDGKKSEAYIPVDHPMNVNKGWSAVAVPLQSLSGFDRTNKIVKSIAFAPDTTSTFYVGEVKILEDTTPIKGDITPSSINLGANQEIRLSGFGMGGASLLKYSWDFDDADGIQEDAVGQSITRKFRKPGTYTITLTISDYFGLKAPYTTTIKATVNG
ncbi:hypothetical protein BH11ARM1_BH11ARM1_00740 [soil metagenome]